MAKKRCTKCNQLKDEEEFSWRKKLLGVRQTKCKECLKDEQHDWYEKNKDKHRENIVNRTLENRDAAKLFVYTYLSNQRCADCGDYDFSVLTFDHVRGTKKMEISQMINQGYSIETILEEISKCEVVCFNCHMRREQKKRSGGRFRKFWPKLPGEE